MKRFRTSSLLWGDSNVIVHNEETKETIIYWMNGKPNHFYDEDLEEVLDDVAVNVDDDMVVEEI